MKNKILGGYRLKPEFQNETGRSNASFIAFGDTCVWYSNTKDDIIDVRRDGAIGKLKLSLVLNIWFNPVYEEETIWKVGNWITAGTNTVQITTIISNHIYVSPNINHKNIYHKFFYINSTIGKNCRLATPEEIEKAENPVHIVKMKCSNIPEGFELEVSRKGIFYRNDNKWLNVDDIKRAINTDIITHSVRKMVSPEESLNAMPYAFRMSAQYIHSGCMLDVPILDWAYAINLHESLKAQYAIY